MIDRIVITLSILATAVIAGMTWIGFNDNPMDLRRNALETDLAKAIPQSVEYVTNADVTYEALIADTVNKKALWRELIKPPPPPPPPPKKIIPPNFVKMLGGIVPSRREQIGRGENLKVKIKNPAVPRGYQYYRVGDVINKCVIIQISDVDILFAFTKDGIEYSYSVARK